MVPNKSNNHMGAASYQNRNHRQSNAQGKNRFVSSVLSQSQQSRFPIQNIQKQGSSESKGGVSSPDNHIRKSRVDEVAAAERGEPVDDIERAIFDL